MWVHCADPLPSLNEELEAVLSLKHSIPELNGTWLAG